MLKTVATLETPPLAESGCKVTSTQSGFEPKYDISCTPKYYARQPYVLVPLFFVLVLLVCGVLFIRKRSAKLKGAMLLTAIAIVVGGLGLFLGRQWLVVSYVRPKVEQAVAKSIEPVRSNLVGMGFHDPDPTKPETDCGYYGYPSDKKTPQLGTALTCSSKVDRLLTVPSDAAAKALLVKQAGELDKILKNQGWKLESDMPTSTWLEKLSGGKEFPPNQSYAKEYGDIACTVSFWTAYSEPDLPALSVVINCDKSGPKS